MGEDSVSQPQTRGPSASDASQDIPPPILEASPELPTGKTRGNDLSAEELEALVVSDLISRNRGLIEVSAFDVIDFLAQTFQKTNYSIMIADLKERGFVQRSKDTEPIAVTRSGESTAQKNQPLARSILETLVRVHRERILSSEKLQRLLLLSYVNEVDAHSFLYVTQQRLTTLEKILAILLCDRSFQLIPQIEMIAAELRSKTIALGQSRLETLSKDKGFLVAISMLRPQTTFELTGVKLAKVVPYGSFTKNLSLVLGPELATEIKEELAKLGIDEKRNIFSFDLDASLGRVESRQTLTQYYTPAKDAIQRLLATDWILFSRVRDLLRKGTNSISLSEGQLQSLVAVRAIFPVKDAILVSGALLDETEKRLRLSEDFLSTKLKGTKALPFLFWDPDLGSRVKNSIVVTVGDFVPDAKVLETNVVLKISPVELGYEGWVGVNQEFNAVGRIDEVTDIKSLFKLAKWEDRENHVIVKAAREIIRGRKFQPFSFEEALAELQRFESRTIEVLSIACNRATPQQAIEKGHYTSENLWNDVWKNFHRMHPLVTEAEFSSFKQKILEIVERRARRKIISLEAKDLSHSPEITSYLRRRFEDRFQKLTQEDRQALFVLVKNRPTSPALMTSPLWPKLFQAQYELAFGQPPKRDALDVLLSLGLLNELLWVTGIGTNYGYIAIPNPFLKDIWESLGDRLNGIKPSTEVRFAKFCDKYKNSVAELAGLEIVLSNRGWLARDQVRTDLWMLDHEYWRKFEDYPFLISSKEKPVIALNSSLIPEIEKFVSESKFSILENRQTVLKQIRDIPNSDLVLESDRIHGIYRGSITLESGKEYSLFVTPWLTRQLLEFPAEHSRVVFITEHRLTLELHNLIRDTSGLIVVNALHEKPTIVSEFEDEIIELITKSLKGFEFTKMVSRPRIPASGANPAEVSSTLREIELARRSAEPVPETDIKVFAGLDLSDIAFETTEVDSSSIESLLFAIPNHRVILLAEKIHDEDYASFLKVLLGEIYRVKRSPAFFQKRHENEEIPLRDNSIVDIYEGDEKLLHFFDLSTLSAIPTELGKTRIIRKLDAVSDCGFGFTVFYCGHHAKEALKPVLLSSLRHFVGKVTFAKLRTLGIDEKKKFAERCWGFVRPTPESSTLDAMFASGQNEYYAKLDEVMVDQSFQPYVVMSNENEEALGYESPEHIAFKYFILSYLSKHHQPKVEPLDVSVEKELPAKPYIVPDLYIPSLKVAVEIETLYGTGATPLPRLTYVLDRYVGVDARVWVVIPPLQSLLFSKPFSLLRKTYDSKVNCRFFTVDVARGRLVSLEESFHSPTQRQE